MDEKLDQSVQPVIFSAPIYYYSEASQASAVGVLEGQPALDDLGNQPGTALYPESQESGTRIHTGTRDLDGILNSSAETLLNTPKTPDTSFENKPQGTQPGAGVIPADARVELGGKKQPNQRGLEQEGGRKPSEFRLHKDVEKAT